MNLNPLGTKIIVTKDEKQKITLNDIVLSDYDKEVPTIATVVAVGIEVEKIQKGDKIVICWKKTKPMSFEGLTYYMIDVENVLRII